MNKIFYAKSDTRETIKEHTEKLLNNLDLLKRTYKNEILNVNNIEKDRFFYLLEITSKYHDIGKVFTPFQNIILEKIGEERRITNFKYNVKHEQLSPIFVPVNKLGLSEDEKLLVYQAIYYHHDRKYYNIDNQEISKIIKEDILPQIEDIKSEIPYEISEKLSPIFIKYISRIISENDKLYNEYCLLKGLLNRLDHSSSALIDVEDDTKENISEYTQKMLISNGYNMNKLQIFSNENKDKNILVIGSTGIGKTESALIWSSNSKLFFTLPLRVSINAIYDRIYDNINYHHVGLLHSTAIDYLENKEEFELDEKILTEIKNMYYKITTCTIDQLFPFVFKYKGYEKIFATLSYSKIIIDEIQAYSPEIVAIILKGLQMINKMGGRFMIMTATLPRIYKDKLEEMGIDFEYGKFIKPIQRHKIKIEQKEISEDIDDIVEKAYKNKILVIVNTVDKAIDLYFEIKEESQDLNINLLHSRFIQEDRNKKEKNIKKFSNDVGEAGIWISTQIVEASLDIDFDYLYTEMSTLDSLFQRMGRCYRNREYNNDEPNIYIYTQNVSGIGEKAVYSKEIFANSIKLLNKYDEQILNEEDKINMVDKLYSKEMLKGTQFIKDFEAGINVLNSIIDYDINKKSAQKLLRNINNVTVIPKKIYEENIELFDMYNLANNVKKKAGIRRKIERLTISISRGKSFKLNMIGRLSCVPGFDKSQLQLIDMKYDPEEGLILNETSEDNYDSREF